VAATVPGAAGAEGSDVVPVLPPAVVTSMEPAVRGVVGVAGEGGAEMAIEPPPATAGAVVTLLPRVAPGFAIKVEPEVVLVTGPNEALPEPLPEPGMMLDPFN